MGGGAEARGAVESLIAFVRTIEGGAAIALREPLGFVGKHRLDSERWRLLALRDFRETMIISQPFAQLQQQGVLAGIGEIPHFDAGGVAASSRSAASDGKDAAAVALREEQGFVVGGIDGIDDGIKPLIENFRRGLFGEKFRDDPDFCRRMDGTGAFCHGFGFLPADLPVHGMELAVDIGDTDFIQVHQSETANAGARKGFHRPGTDASYADDGDTGDEETVQRRLAIKPGNAAKAMGEGVWHGRKMRCRGNGVTTESRVVRVFLI